MSLRADEVLTRLAASLEGLVVTAGTLTEASVGYDDMPAMVPATRAHNVFALHSPRSIWAGETRQRAGVARRVVSDVSLRLLHRYRAQSSPHRDMRDAMQVEGEAITAILLAESKGIGLETVYVGTSVRQSVQDPKDLYLIQVDFRATHYQPA